MKTFLSFLVAVTLVASLCLAADYSTKADTSSSKTQTTTHTITDDLNKALKDEFCKDIGKGIYKNARLVDSKNNNVCN